MVIDGSRRRGRVNLAGASLSCHTLRTFSTGNRGVSGPILLKAWRQEWGLGPLLSGHGLSYLERMANITELEKEVNDLCLAGKAQEIVQKFYADNASTVEPNGETTQGKDAISKRTEEWFAGVEDLKSDLLSWAAGEDTSFSEWDYEVKFKGAPGPAKFQEVIRRQWKDGKIVSERYYYKPPEEG